MTGTDWRAYETMYGWVSDADSSNLIAAFVEPGFLVYMKLFQFLGISFWPFLIFTKLATFGIFVHTINRYSNTKFFFFILAFFISWYGFFLWIDNPMRNLIAIAIFLLGIPSLIKRKFFVFFVLTLIAVSFHFSAIVMLLIYWLGNKRLSSVNILLIYIVVNIALLSRELIFGVLNFVFSGIPFIANKIISYFLEDGIDGGGKLITIGFMLHNIFFFILLLTRKNIESLKNGNLIFNLSILYFVFFRIGLTVTVMGRFQLFIGIFYSIALISLSTVLDKKLKTLYLAYVFMICLLSTYSSLSKDFRYIPYTNYLWYIYSDKPSFDYRDKYNPTHSPYKEN